jgi:hypothetical protein
MSAFSPECRDCQLHQDLNLGIYYSLVPFPSANGSSDIWIKTGTRRVGTRKRSCGWPASSLTYAYPSQVKQKLARAHEGSSATGISPVTYDVTREGEDKVIYDFTDGGAKIDGYPSADAKAASQLVLDFYAQLTGQPDLAYQPAPRKKPWLRTI